jgi:hypothetical protein
MRRVAFKIMNAEGLLDMKWKLVSAFATGAVLASAIVYFAVKPVGPEVAPPPAPIVEATKPAPVAQAPAQVAQAKVQPAPLPEVRKPVHVPPSVHVPVREKPSPFRAPIRHEEVAKLTPPAPVSPPPASAAAPEPAPAPPSAAPPKIVPTQNVSLPAPSAPTRVANTVTLTAGTLLPVRIGESLSSAHNQPGDIFLATLTQPLVVDGWVIAERGAHVRGRVIDKDAVHLRISLVWFATSDGQSIPVHTGLYIKLAPADIPVDARITFKVQEPVTITERLD